MSYGPVTHAGSNWRKLCARYNLDPLEATADHVERAMRATDQSQRLPPVVLTLWQKGRTTAFSIVGSKFVEGLIDGAPVITPLTACANQLLLRAEEGAAGFRLRALTDLVSSVPDSFIFERTGDAIRNCTAPIDDTPWRMAVSDIILTHFAAELRRFMPQGIWHLAVTLDINGPSPDA